MKNVEHPCDLCGQPVKVAGFALKMPLTQKKFCCEGCLSIYQLLNPEPQPNNNKKENMS